MFKCVVLLYECGGLLFFRIRIYGIMGELTWMNMDRYG